MRSRLINDLTSWEWGELSLEALSARHQGADVAGTIALHRTFTQVTAHDVAPPTAQQVERLLARLPERAVRGGVLSALQTSTSRRLVALLTSVLMSGGVAYAAGYTPVKERVDSVLRGITSLFDGSKGDGDPKGSDGDPSGERPGAAASPGNETTPGSAGPGQHDGSPGTNPSGDDSPEGDDETGDDATPDDHEGDGETDDDKGDDAKGDATKPDPDDSDEVDEPDEDGEPDEVDEPDEDDDSSGDTDEEPDEDDDISEDNDDSGGDAGR